MTIPTNLFTDLPQHLPKELVQTLLEPANIPAHQRHRVE